jgi:hypothetical protein
MASLLAKLRIDYANLTMVHDVSDKPHPRTVKLFAEIVEPFKEDPTTVTHDKSTYFLHISLEVNKVFTLKLETLCTHKTLVTSSSKFI